MRTTRIVVDVNDADDSGPPLTSLLKVLAEVRAGADLFTLQRTYAAQRRRLLERWGLPSHDTASDDEAERSGTD